MVKILGILRLQSRNRHTSTTEIHLHKRSLNQWLCGQDIFFMCLFRILILVGLSWCKYFHVQYLFVKTFVIRAKTDWSSTKKIQLNMLVSYKVDLIIISFKINLFSAWYGWKIDGLALNTLITHTNFVWSFPVISMTRYFQVCEVSTSCLTKPTFPIFHELLVCINQNYFKFGIKLYLCCILYIA